MRTQRQGTNKQLSSQKMPAHHFFKQHRQVFFGSAMTTILFSVMQLAVATISLSDKLQNAEMTLHSS